MSDLTQEHLQRVWQSIADSEESFVPVVAEYPGPAAAAEGLEEWEHEVEMYCSLFLSAKRGRFEGNYEMAEDAAFWIGKIIANQLMEGNLSAPRIVGEALLRVKTGGKFKLHSGRAPSRVRTLVLWAFSILEMSRRIARPSQREVQKFLLEHGLKLTAPHLSKIFDELGLKAHSSKASEAASAAGRRKRGKP